MIWHIRAVTGFLACSLAAAPITLVPRPAHVEQGSGAWLLTPTARVVAPGAAAGEGLKLAGALSAALGRVLPVVTAGAGASDIFMTLDPARADLGAEGYELTVDRSGVRITARGPAGLFYAGQSLRQLLPAAAWRRASATSTNWEAPYVRIVDAPRFEWRGLLLDPARHFIPKAAVLEILDVMAMHKLNRLQLHLTDDQGWRIELRSFPLLTARSSWRDGTLIGRLHDGPLRFSAVPHGGYYSQDDVREMVAYAAARHITVVPEIEMPGHTRALVSAYPELGVFPAKAAQLGLWQQWGVSKDVLAPRPRTMEACRRLLDEVCELFPSPWIHTGGDEAPRDQWRESAEMQALIRSLGLQNEDQLQAWFTAELSRHLAAKGRRLVGWDEILAGAEMGGRGKTSPAPNAIVMSWRGEKGGEAAAKAGHDVIMAPNQWTYLDYYQGPPEEEPLGIGGSISLARTQAYEPVPAAVPTEAAGHILGAQAQVWSEYLPNSDAVAYMAFPRACALAEDFWSPREGKDLAEFLGRLEKHEARLLAAGIPYHPLTRRTSWPDASGRITARPRDAVILGTDVTRQDDGTLSGWRDPYTLIAWKLGFPAQGKYRIRALVVPGRGAATQVEAIIGGFALRASPDATGAADLGLFDAGQGAQALFVRGTGIAGIRGVEVTPAQ